MTNKNTAGSALQPAIFALFVAATCLLIFANPIFSEDCTAEASQVGGGLKIRLTGAPSPDGDPCPAYGTNGTYYFTLLQGAGGIAGSLNLCSGNTEGEFDVSCPGIYTYYTGWCALGDAGFVPIPGLANPCMPIQQLAVECGPPILDISGAGLWISGKKYKVTGNVNFCDKDLSENVSWKFDDQTVGYGKNPEFTVSGSAGLHTLSLYATICGANYRKDASVFLVPQFDPTPSPTPWPTCGATTGAPIGIMNGNKAEKVSDISIKNNGHDLEFGRLYNSDFVARQISQIMPESAIGKMGIGWRTNYDFRAEVYEKYIANYSSGVGGSINLMPGGSSEGNVTVGVVTGDGSVSAMGMIPGVEPLYGMKFTLPEGNQYIFRQRSSGSSEYVIPGSTWKALRQGDGSFRVIMDLKTYSFDTAGRLIAIKDLAGKGVTLQYDTQNSQTIVTDNHNRQLVIRKDQNGNINQMDAPGNETYIYEYANNLPLWGSSNYFLTKADRPGNEDAEYGYLAQFWMVSFSMPVGLLNWQKDLRKDGVKEINYVINYYGYTPAVTIDNFRYKGETDAAGNDLAQLGLSADNIGFTPVTDKNGMRTYYFNQYGNISHIGSPDGQEVMQYDQYGRLTQKKQKNGTTEDYHFNGAGYVDWVTTTWNDVPGGQRSKTEYYGYDSNGNLTSYTDGENHTTTYQYDGYGRITHIIQGGKDTSYSYYSSGLVRTIHDGENMSKTYTYDSYGNVTQVKNNATGGIETFAYGAYPELGKVNTYTGEDGVVKTYIYNAFFPSKIHTIYSDGGSLGSELVTYGYDARGNMTSIADHMGTVIYTYKTDNSDLLWKERDRTGGEKTYTYDSWRRMTGISDTSGGSKTYSYDFAGRIAGVLDGLGKGMIYGYDNVGNRTSVRDRNGKLTSYAYDGLSRLRKVTDANGGITEYDYDKNGNRTLIKDAENHSTTYEYDGYDRMEKETFAGGSYVSYTYSIGGDLKKREVYNSSGLQKTQEFMYDNGHRLTNDGIYTYSFSCTCGRLGSVSGPDGTISYDYDYKGRVNKVTYGDGTVVENVFNETAKTRTIKLDGTILYVLNLDGEGRAAGLNAVVEQIGSASNAFGITRDEMGRIEAMTYPNQDSSTTEYDLEGRIKKHRNYYKNKLINKFEETLDAEGNKLKEKTNVGTRNYGYDGIYQLTSATYERNQAYNWQYDNAGNRLVETQLAVSRSYMPNGLNQYASVNSVNYGYDSDGNLLSDGTHTFGWDAKNRLTTAVNGSTTVTYKYDHNDLRVEKTVGGVTTKYFYEGNLLLAEKVGSQITKIYINDGQGIIGMVRPIYGGSNNLTHYQRLYYLYDSLGSVSAVTGEHGLPLQNYTYSPFGTCLNVTGDPINNLQFVGRYGGYLDNDSGLTYFWHRWYDSRDGRWISRDPINVYGGINLYNYVENAVTKRIDASGLFGDKTAKDQCPNCLPPPPPCPSPTSPTPNIRPENRVCKRCDKALYWTCVATGNNSDDTLSCIQGTLGVSVGVAVITKNLWAGGAVAVIGGLGCGFSLHKTCSEVSGCD